MSDNINRLQPNARHRDFVSIREGHSAGGGQENRQSLLNSNGATPRTPSINSNESWESRMLDVLPEQSGRRTPSPYLGSDSENENESEPETGVVSRDHALHPPPSRALLWLAFFTVVLGVAASGSTVVYVLFGQTDAAVNRQLSALELK